MGTSRTLRPNHECMSCNKEFEKVKVKRRGSSPRVARFCFHPLNSANGFVLMTSRQAPSRALALVALAAFRKMVFRILMTSLTLSLILMCESTTVMNIKTHSKGHSGSSAVSPCRASVGPKERKIKSHVL